MSYGRRFKPSRAAAKAFAETMHEIDIFCTENGIIQSSSSDSYYFTIDEQSYRVSNHSVEASRYHSHGKYHEEGRKDDTIYIHASKTRIIEIYTALQAGKKLDGRGNII